MLSLKPHKKVRKIKKSKDAPKKKFKGTGLRIVDEEESFGFGRSAKADSSDDEQAEELPQIAAVVDERPREVQMQEEFEKGKWKTLQTLEQDSSGFKSVGPGRHDSDSDSSLPRSRQRHDSDSDDGDLSPPRNRQRHDSDADLSPPRNRQRHDSDGDLSPPRNRNHQRHDSGDLSPPRVRQNQNQRQRHDSDGDLSPPRQRDSNSNRNARRKSSDSDLSPPRSSSSYSNSGRSPGRSRYQPHSSGSKRSIERPEIIEADKQSLVPGTTLEGKKAGLQRAHDLRKEMVDYKRKENELFANLDDEVSGRNARTKIRDKTTGLERDLAGELAKKQEEERIAAEKKKLYDKWGKGLKQVEAQQTRVTEALHEASKPLARYEDDKDLDEYLRNQVRDGDPMLKFLSAKKKAIAGIDKPRYSGPPPMPNRFGIHPGCRWDGVDRSNGYEKEWFSRINAKKALQEEAYKWSVEDL